MKGKPKKKEGLARLFEIAGQKKGLLILAGLLSAGSAVCMLVPYWAVYEVLKELLTHGSTPASDGTGIIRWGWIALGGLACGLVLLYASLMSSHVAAFRILYGLRIRLSVGKKAKEFTKDYYDAQERMSASAVQYVRGMPVVKIFGQSVLSFRQFNAEIQAYKTFALKCCDTYQNGMIAFTVLLNSMVTFILPVGVLLMQATPQSLSMAAVWLFFIILGPGMASPVYKLTFLGGNTREIDEGVARIDHILEKEPVPEPEHPQIPVSYDVEFRNVSFSYENTVQGTRTEALRDVSFSARQGEITALVGPSGSGKSTVANLIPRFWDVGQGEILIGGVDIRQMTTEKLMETVSFVFQDTFLFYDTLYENIAVGSPEATRESVIAAARAAQCHDFIERLPEGYDTKIGDSGVFLSGGEAQRVCVARAILKDARIILLDEATASLDPENEVEVQKAIDSLIKGRTVIAIAHRLKTVMDADRIMVLEDGRIKEQGAHDTLLLADGLYARMWRLQENASGWKL